jgi:hypothetical protein
MQHILIKEHDGAESLVLGAGGDAAVDCQVGQEGRDLVLPHVTGVDPTAGPLPPEPQELFHPTSIGGNRPWANRRALHAVTYSSNRFMPTSIPRKKRQVNSRRKKRLTRCNEIC